MDHLKTAKYCSKDCQKADWKVKTPTSPFLSFLHLKSNLHITQSHKAVCNNHADLVHALQEHENTPLGLMERLVIPDGMSRYELDQRLEKWVKFHRPILMWATTHALGLPSSLSNADNMVLYLRIKPTTQSYHGGSVAKGFQLLEAYTLPIEEANNYPSPWPEMLEQFELLRAQCEARGQGKVAACVIECSPLAVQIVPFRGLRGLGIPRSLTTWKETMEQHFDEGKKMAIPRS